MFLIYTVGVYINSAPVLPKIRNKAAQSILQIQIVQSINSLCTMWGCDFYGIPRNSMITQ
jgi:hypothetical protein